MVLGDALVGVANMLMRLSIIEMERCDWMVLSVVYYSRLKCSLSMCRF